MCHTFGKCVEHEFVHIKQFLIKSDVQGNLHYVNTDKKKYLSLDHEIEAHAHTIVFDLLRSVRNVSKNKQFGILKPILNNHLAMAAKNKQYDLYLTHTDSDILDKLDATINELLLDYFENNNE